MHITSTVNARHCSLGGPNLKIQIQSHFKKMDYEDSAVYSFVKTKYTLLDHNKRFLVICFSPTLSTFKIEFSKIVDWLKIRFVLKNTDEVQIFAFCVFEVTQELLSEHVSLI